MKNLFITVLVGLFLSCSAAVVFPAEFGTAPEAEAMVKKAIAYTKANGQEKAFAEIGNQKGQFVDRDLYIFVYDINGKCVAHGANAKMVGKDLREMKDVDGRSYVKERIEIIKTKGKGWQDYKFTNPLNKKIEPKTAYVEGHENLIFGCGIYKK